MKKLAFGIPCGILNRYSFVPNLLVIVFALFLKREVTAQETIAFFNFDNDTLTSWTTGATGLNWKSNNRCSWEIGTPNGGQGYNNIPGQKGFIGNPDPVTDFSPANAINNVAGQGLSASSKKQGKSGYYNNSSEWIASPAINCSNYYNVSLSFWRWANFEPGYDFAYVEITQDGNNWFAVEHPLNVEDTDWTLVTIDISEYADWSSSIQIRFRSESDESIFYSGWNIDDVLITGKHTLNDINSTITAGTIEVPTTVSSLTDTYDERVAVGSFTITDAGAGDNLPTLIDTLVIVSGDNNTITNWKKAINKAYLHSTAFTSLPNNELKASVREDSIFFACTNILSIADGSSESFELRLYLEKDLSDLNDNDNFEFELQNANQIINPAGSFIAGGKLETGASKLKIDIEATELQFKTEPEQLISLNRMILPTMLVAATDENGNIDKDFDADISLSNSHNLGMIYNQASAISGEAKFISTQFTETGGPVTLSTNHTGDLSIQNVTTSVQVTVQENLDNIIFFDNFDNSEVTGWTTGADKGQTSWAEGVPNGGKGYSSVRGYRGYVGNADPKKDISPNSTNRVFGQGLTRSSSKEGASSYYNESDEWLMTPALDCKNYYNIQFSFWRWANLEPDYDTAFVEISTDGNTWNKLDHPAFPEDRNWVYISYDISQYADRQEKVYIRWRSLSDESIHYSGWNIDDVELIGVYSPLTEWTGEVSTDWNHPANWSSLTVPNELSNVYINANTPFSPVIQGSVSTCNDIVLKTDAVLEILTDASLTVFGDFTIETTETNYGSVVDRGILTVHGKGRMSRTISNKKWHYVSSPFTNINSSVFGDKVYKYNEPAASADWLLGWEQVIDVNMTPGTGFDIYSNKKSVVVIQGQFNTGNHTVIVTNTDGTEIADHEGWNLIGNPYPSAIDWDASNGWTKENINNAIYIWDKEQQNFVTYISGVGANGGTNYIPPMQGFFIKVSSPGTGTLQMTNDVRVTNNKALLKSTGSPDDEGLKIQLASSYYTDETIVRFSEVADNGFDKGLDAEKKFTTNKSVPQIYTTTHKSEQLAINTLKKSDDYHQIPLYLTVYLEDTYTINFEGIYNIDYSKTLYLEDLATGEFVNLDETLEYSFVSTLSIDSARFVLHIGMPLTIEYEVEHVSNAGGNDGAIDLTVRGGKFSVKDIEWSNGITQEDLTNISAGKYTVIVTDGNNNSIAETITVLQPGTNGELTDITEINSNETIKIYTHAKELILLPSDDSGPIDLITIYDMLGRIVYHSESLELGKISIDLNELNGNFIARVRQNKMTSSQQIILK